MEITDFHQDYLKITEMLAPIEIKVRMLSILLGATENPWHVVGITQEALKKLSDNDFKYTQGINRAHKKSRNETYLEMLTQINRNPDDWWRFYTERDKTVLATSSQNMREELEDIIEFNNDKNLFRPSGFTFRYTAEEKEFLKSLGKS